MRGRREDRGEGGEISGARSPGRGRKGDGSTWEAPSAGVLGTVVLPQEPYLGPRLAVVCSLQRPLWLIVNSIVCG